MSYGPCDITSYKKDNFHNWRINWTKIIKIDIQDLGDFVSGFIASWHNIVINQVFLFRYRDYPKDSGFTREMPKSQVKTEKKWKDMKKKIARRMSIGSR